MVCRKGVRSLTILESFLYPILEWNYIVQIWKLGLIFSTVPEYFQFAVKVFLEVLDVGGQVLGGCGHLCHLVVECVHLSQWWTGWQDVILLNLLIQSWSLSHGPSPGGPGVGLNISTLHQQVSGHTSRLPRSNLKTEVAFFPNWHDTAFCQPLKEAALKLLESYRS